MFPPGQFVAAFVNGNHWVNQDVAALPKADGGMAVPNLKAELLAFAATEVSRWAMTSTYTMMIVGDILFAERAGPTCPDTYITRGHRVGGIKGLSFPITFWDAGRLACEAALDTPDRLHLANVHAHATCTLPRSSWDWADGQCLVNITPFKGDSTAALRDWCRTTRGTPCFEWLPYLEIRYLQLYDVTGVVVNPKIALPLLSSPHTTIGDVLGWRHVTSDHIVFQAHLSGLPTTIASAARLAQLARFILLLLCNFPDIVYEKFGPDEM